MTDSSGSAHARMVDALNEPDRLYDRGQLAFFMAQAVRWGVEIGQREGLDETLAHRAGWLAGYEDAYAEITARASEPYPPPPYVLVSGEQVALDRSAPDHTQKWAGGTAEQALERFMWEADRPDHRAPTGRLYVRPWRGTVVWDEDRIAASEVPS